MRVLQIGLGSMGKRRIRNLMALGIRDVIGFDLRKDRRLEAFEKYGVKTSGVLTGSLLKDRDVYIISTPPDQHNKYMKLALKYRKPAFVEASVIRDGLLGIDREASQKKVRIVPSATMRFHPAVKIIKKIVNSNRYGKVCNFSYHMGQYLPDWHPWEDIKKFYVSKRKTSAAREMVPFELTWIVDIIGMPNEVSAFKGKTLNLGVDIDDTYVFAIKFQSGLGIFMVDVVARFATRSFILNLEKAQIRWNWEEKQVKIYQTSTKKWKAFSYGSEHVAGYNKNIAENMYVEELRAFFKELKGGKSYPNTLRDDAAILGILELGEHCVMGKKIY
ncbi:gfo/Idh/MocA family oxidoreductase [bacterium]|nr:MAG: gfo/Idh/MocA family oxidoreductase [bacterium]